MMRVRALPPLPGDEIDDQRMTIDDLAGEGADLDHRAGQTRRLAPGVAALARRRPAA